MYRAICGGSNAACLGVASRPDPNGRPWHVYRLGMVQRIPRQLHRHRVDGRSVCRRAVRPVPRAETMTTVESRPWTARLRGRAVSVLPPDQLLPDEQPAYVSSWIYVFGVASLASFLFVLGSGLVLAIVGPQWYHVSNVGRFVNSLHLWSVELFFFSMVVHLWGKFFMAAWRGRRALTWITGVVAFLGSILTALTGYLIQSNFESQWIASQAKDGL